MIAKVTMKTKITVLILVIACIWIFLYMNNHWLQESSYEIQSDRIPQAFDGLKIVQLSDLHDATFGEGQTKLAEKVKKLDPDLIFLTGDFIDSNRYNLENSLDLIEKLVDITDVYYVTGNHEVAINRVGGIMNAFQSKGVHVLNNKTEILSVNGEQLALSGVEDPLMKGMELPEEAVEKSMKRAYSKVSSHTYRILLSHRPEVFDVYIEQEVDLVLTGHAHGGQIRIPGVGGLIAPGQGWMPKYTAGKHTSGVTTMIVNRGLGNSIIPYRVFNRPEIVVVTLRKE